ncbi:hypothetical protein PHYSODRAFT_343290 [Phytophthora sojae]|uniref:Uncharacterized protein n=1 Tax=Phytophthora sojae (strain P6497) TaxID=1094619 RepID=G5AJ92_PHYSP|nr:hypothetical protein PHYSODRAFT_343290 [Phytophthora sojae]EGZ04410.1 hypothetical protein PHYSODRAFT_343290 [Phytophthora sojae]|eukprot:XP_009540143.1 hypothetical protein PHYSODRAFT_343290 [Phytophthora sojae]
MALDGQDLRWLESYDYCPWGTHVSRSLERKNLEPQEIYSFAVIVGGKEELPNESFTSVCLDLFDLKTTKWLTSYDVHDELAHSIGHTVVTLGENAYAYGYEPIDSFEPSHQQLIGDVFELGYENNVLYCTDVSPINGDGTDPNVPPDPAPCGRAWHASAPPTGNSPLPLAFHNAVAIGEGDKVAV